MYVRGIGQAEDQGSYISPTQTCPSGESCSWIPGIANGEVYFGVGLAFVAIVVLAQSRWKK